MNVTIPQTTGLTPTAEQSPTTTREHYTNIRNSAQRWHMAKQLWFDEAKVMPTYENKKTKQQGPIFDKFPSPSKEANEQSHIQPWWSQRLKRFPPTTFLQAVDGHAKPTLGTRKPDTVIYFRDRPKSLLNMVALGDNKPLRSKELGDFDDVDKGHMVELLLSLIHQQPFRRIMNSEGVTVAEATGFLSNSWIIQFFRLKMLGNEIHLDESEPMYLEGKGGLALMGLLNAEPYMLGWTVPLITVNNNPIVPLAFLGSGSSALVFKAEFQKKNVVVKRFIPKQKERLSVEIKVLNALQNLQPRVPAVVATSDDKAALLLTPVGRRFASRAVEVAEDAASSSLATSVRRPVRATAQHFEQIIDTLAQAHKLGVVHCDMKLTNCFDISHLSLNNVSTFPKHSFEKE